MGFVSDLFGDLTGANDAADAAGRASDIQAQVSREGIGEQRRQFDQLVQLLSPFVSAGQQSVSGQVNLLGLGGDDAQQSAISGIESSPQFQALMQQGENALRQNASATGGLRGGNIQAALAKFRPNLLSQLIEQQFSRLGNVSVMGQNAAAGQGTAGMASADNVGNLLQQQGAAQAGGILAKGNAGRQTFGDLLKIGAIAGSVF